VGRGLVAAAATVVLAVVDVLVERLRLVAVLDQRVDLLGRHAAIRLDQQRVRRRLQAVVDEQRVDGEVAGQVPLVLDAVLAAGEVRERAVQRLVREHELRLRQRQGGDVLGIEVEGARVRRGGRAPVLLCRHHRQPQRERAEERLVEDEPGPCGGELRLELCGVVGHS
jgi:hypothetical protein